MSSFPAFCFRFVNGMDVVYSFLAIVVVLRLVSEMITDHSISLGIAAFMFVCWSFLCEFCFLL